MEDFDEIDRAWQTAEPAPPGGGRFDPVPAGTKVKVAITNQKPDQVGPNQTAVCKVTFEVMEPKEYVGKWIWHDFWLTTANVKYLKRDLGILGWKGERLAPLMENDNASLMCLGAEVEVDVEDYVDKKGEKRQKNVIKFFAGPWTPPAPSEQKKPSKPAEPAKVEDDAIPF